MMNFDSAENFKVELNALPCPFCGEKKDICTFAYQHTAGTRYAILCMGCMAGIDPGWAQSRGAVLEIWNKRTEAKTE